MKKCDDELARVLLPVGGNARMHLLDEWRVNAKMIPQPRHRRIGHVALVRWGRSRVLTASARVEVHRAIWKNKAFINHQSEDGDLNVAMSEHLWRHDSF